MGLHCWAGFSPAAESRGHSRWVRWLLNAVVSLVAEQGSRTQARQLWLPGPRAQAQQSRCTDFAVLRPVGSSRNRDRNGVPGTARWILNQWTTGEALKSLGFNLKENAHDPVVENWTSPDQRHEWKESCVLCVDGGLHVVKTAVKLQIKYDLIKIKGVSEM